MNETKSNWYAIKICTAKPEIISYLDTRGIESYIPMLSGKPLLASLLFIRCPEETVLRAKSDWFSQIIVYRDAERKKPQAIPEAEMDNFRMVLNIKNQDFIPLEIKDRSFLVGQKVRVIDGPLKGTVGVVKRIKGDRRLVVSVTGIAAIATSFVRPDMLENLN